MPRPGTRSADGRVLINCPESVVDLGGRDLTHMPTGVWLLNCPVAGVDVEAAGDPADVLITVKEGVSPWPMPASLD